MSTPQAFSGYLQGERVLVITDAVNGCPWWHITESVAIEDYNFSGTYVTIECVNGQRSVWDMSRRVKVR